MWCEADPDICEDAEAGPEDSGNHRRRRWSHDACFDQDDPGTRCEQPGHTMPGCECQYFDDGRDTHQTRPGPGGCQICTCDDKGRLSCSCVVRERKEIHDMSRRELTRLFDAINLLKHQGKWDLIAKVHDDHQRDAHSRRVWRRWRVETRFLPWHRRFL